MLVPDAEVVTSACPFAPLMAGICALDNEYAASVTALSKPATYVATVSPLQIERLLAAPALGPRLGGSTSVCAPVVVVRIA